MMLGMVPTTNFEIHFRLALSVTGSVILSQRRLRTLELLKRQVLAKDSGFRISSLSLTLYFWTLKRY
jgi:hypothetical protein